ncbi:MAG TPA: AmmeMemoRadiSam system protein B [Ignavibacteriaceae bacterium]|nr:AmmeMemoRadiSam system protein B [Ignavibacteriaceae bacterium]
MPNLRKPAVAGLFYPADKNKLIDELNLLLSITDSHQEIKKVFGIVVPHAGYVYSGRTAAYAFNILKHQNIKNVIIISPSHREYFRGVSIYDGIGFDTPLGPVLINKDKADKLVEGSDVIFKSTKGHNNEHAIEVQIPFLQSVLNDFKIIPVVMGDQKKMYVDALAEKLLTIMDDETIITASSDLSHYYSKDVASEMDSLVEEGIKNFDIENLRQNFEMRNCEACGEGAILTLMKAASLAGIKKSMILNRSDSGDTTGSDEEVVGYLSAIFYE